jgi:hypothetical protein
MGYILTELQGKEPSKPNVAKNQHPARPVLPRIIIDPGQSAGISNPWTASIIAR